MDACLSVQKEVDKVLGKFDGIKAHSQRTLEELIDSLNNIRHELSSAEQHSERNRVHQLILNSAQNRTKDILTRVSNEHKDIHSSVSKVGKAIDKNFVSDLIQLNAEQTFESPERMHLLNEVICEHFLRQGMLDIAENLTEEAGLDMLDSAKEPFLEINQILEALKQKDLQPALIWASRHREQLQAMNSSLEFKLHRLRFIELVCQGGVKQQEALAFARNFSLFAQGHTKEFQVLMGSLLYIRQGLEHTPYSHLLDPIQWDDISDVFTQDACSLLGLSVESPLTVSISAGCVALPALLNIRQVMQQRQCQVVWSAKDELPIEVDLGEAHRYHSIFACPILRQQTSDTNPPVKLACGHAISRDSLNKLTNGNKIKCPYCPIESTPAESKQLYL
ncbi:E3 ubiquitin-protein ligase RMND5A-like [Asterias rubens]|uniref:E3 ubiquitin-protein ligase RMND5A-like n=1 Tax=Asterias rubens TaxID=7604 RepID=UPI001455165E|nr:E3 ubiquitin-protein ligase RMND5A-like [Asterias rubens]